MKLQNILLNSNYFKLVIILNLTHVSRTIRVFGGGGQPRALAADQTVE